METVALMFRSIGVGVAIIGFGGIMFDGTTPAGWYIAIAGLTLFILGATEKHG